MYEDSRDNAVFNFDLPTFLERAYETKNRPEKPSFPATTHSTAGVYRIPLCRLCEKLMSEFKMPDCR